MLEQAVYARRNHTAILAWIFWLLLSGSAQAADVLRLGLKSEISTLVTAPDGGAWVSVHSAERPRVVRVTPQNALRSLPLKGYDGHGTLGPDGRAWFESGDGILRVDQAGAGDTLPVDGRLYQLATGPDGAVWLSTNPLTRVAPDGSVTRVPVAVPGCEELRPHVLTVASDGALWLATVCGFVRVPPGGTPAVVAKPRRGGFARKLVPDSRGGVWFSADTAPGGGHVDAAGRLTPLKSEDWSGMQDVALAPDGTAWFATGRCSIAAAGADGTLTPRRTPVPVWHLGFDGTGGVWLASAARLLRTTVGAPAGRCDDTPPRARIVPDPSKPVSLATLRRRGGFELTVREPFAVDAVVYDLDADSSIASVDRAVTARRGRTVRLPMSARLLRSLERSPRAPRAGSRSPSGTVKATSGARTTSCA